MVRGGCACVQAIVSGQSGCWKPLVFENPKKPCLHPHAVSSSVSQKLGHPCKLGCSLIPHCQKLPAFSLG